MRRAESQRTLEYFIQRLVFLTRARGVVAYRFSSPHLLYPIGFFFTDEPTPEIPNIDLKEQPWFAEILEKGVTILSFEDAQEKSLPSLGPTLIAPVYSKRRDPESGEVIEKELEGLLVVTGKREEETFNQDDRLILARLVDQLASIIVTSRIADYELALERFPVGVLSIDLTTGRILLCNARAGEAIGQDEIIGQDYREILPEALIELIGQAQVTGQSEAEITSPVTGRIFRVGALYQSPSNERQINQVVLGFIDATYIHQTEAIVAQMSHDLRTPLTSISGYGQTLRAEADEVLGIILEHCQLLLQLIDRDDLRKPLISIQECAQTLRADANEFLGISLDHSQLLSQLIDQLLSIARLRAGKALELQITEFDLVQLISEMLRVYADRFTADHKPVVGMPESLIVEADKTKIQQVILNLITNAVKYSPEGGEVRIKVEDLGEEAMVSISDQGIGIKKEDIARIGDWCFRTDYSRDIGSGIGIGLFFVRNLIEAHNGRLIVESKGLGRGSTFSFIIPKKASKN